MNAEFGLDPSYLWLSQLEHEPWFAPLTERPEPVLELVACDA